MKLKVKHIKSEDFKTYCENLGIKVYADESVLATMPPVKKGKIEVFALNKYISDDDLAKEYKSRGLIPADPHSMAQYWLDSDIKYLATHWKDADDKWCYATFDRWLGERLLFVHRHDVDWDDVWWFAGLRKFGTKVSETKTSSEPLNSALSSKISMEEAFKDMDGRIAVLETQMSKLQKALK